MRIRTQLTISILVFFVTLAATAASVAVMTWQIHETADQEKIASRIARISQELVYLGEDYMLYGEAAQLDRWRSRFEQLSTETALVDLQGAGQMEIVRSIKTDQQWLKEVFDSWTSTHRERDPAPDSAFLQTSWSRMIIQGKALAMDAARLVDSIQEDADRSRRANMLFLYGMVAVLVIQLILNHFIIQRRTLESIKALRDGTEVIGSGNFDFALQVTKDDEIGDLKRSFSRMAEKLKAVTAKKSDLEREIRERQRTEEALRRSEERVGLAVEGAGMGSWDLDLRSGRAAWSPTVFETLGYPPDGNNEGTIEMWRSRVHPDDLEGVNGAMEAARASDSTCITEHRILRADTGEVRWVSSFGRYLCDSGGEPVRFVGILFDDTERRQMEEELRGSEGRLKELLAEKEALLKEIHHRVKNNMQVISSLVDLQADEVKDAALREIFREVNYRVRSMAMVHEKLYQSRDLAHVEFADYAESLLGYMWRAQGMAASRIRLNLELERVFLPVNAAVPCGLILNELFSNALKHAFKGRDSGSVDVSLRGNAEGKVSLCVRDDGVGLPPGMDWEKSHSLGLRIVKTLARQLHATVEAHSGSGTRFTIRFGKPDAGAATPPPTSDPAGRHLCRS